MDPFLGEIRRFSSSTLPAGWLACDGQMLSISEYTVLHAVLTNTYGGDGITTFALPNLQGRTPVGETSSQMMGQSGGGSGASQAYVTVVYAIATTGEFPVKQS